ncbi:hypothetical protein BamIOP4010DRAFT_2899 [Burkholderia ambifaria IOP40-10]|uniref:Fluoride ion transporter CrcB n=1 Tax=Burkholderia ambifaria IOP40-10 TaxID=396596 RepID=B1FFT9_9BURK|nr:hypothetical protein BamIOP4010DRAFT_2899 [Burkholderia ambifaria IOP40-10]
MFYSIVAIFVGAGLGALLRWFLSLALNEFFPAPCRSARLPRT